MNNRRLMDVGRLGLMLVLLCILSLPHLAGAAPLAPIPTGPLSAYNGIPDYYTTANWANSPPLAKFVNTLAPLGCASTNNIGQCLPVAVPDTTTYPGSDYYIIELREYSEKMHTDLNPTKLRGYVQVNAAGADVAPIHYLGPVIVAERDRPVRIKFTNKLPTGAGGDLFIPVDETVMGAGAGPIPGQKYTQNRADLHLHGGRTPWISDGTPHQWIIPAGENTSYTKGVSMQNVPDMPYPGDNSVTYYYTNQQSARLMFYHDHAFGITRLNVYAGEAAGYVITDKYEKDLVQRGILPADQIPLIIQDKTFVDATPTVHPVTGLTVPKVRITDPLWNWGSAAPVGGVVPPVTGDLWMPHVYMPAQMPTGSATGGVNPFGRWMYGPWFFPATAVVHGPVANPYYDPNCSSADPFILAQCETPGQPPLIPGTPNVSMGMEAFQDSAVVNGTVFPTLTVDPRAYRFRILNAASDRFQNLSFYVADPAQVSPDTRPASRLTEVKTVPASLDFATANNWPADWPVDGREGGVPDPGLCQPGGVNCPNLGPSFLQIGTEGGFLPNPVVINPQPITYITDPTAFWVGIVDKMGLALGPAERADVIVDFSAYAGKTLILYNDAPAAWPARVPGYDYFTGAPDRRDSGGYGTGGTFDPITQTWVGGTGTLVGYAPNTRTVMQVIVNPTLTGPGNTYSQANLEKEFTAAAPGSAGVYPAGQTLFERAQEPIVVGQAAYSSAYPSSYFPVNAPWEGVNQINDQFLQFVTVAGEQVTVPTEPKGIHDEMGASFDPEYGRMSGNLAMQLPNPTTLNALLVLYGYSDLPTEYVTNSPTLNVQVLPNPTPGMPGSVADGTQIWKISHNGVDTHPIHFHIFDVQLINRVGWDGQLRMPEPNELGWKDTVKISPLMDTIVAVRPRAPSLPFGIPNSLRPLNPAIPIDSAMNFTTPTPGSDWPFFSSIDWTTGELYVFDPGPPPFPYDFYKGVVTNVLHDFGWEYVWHCHILSHEEMDMMRPIVLRVNSIVPPAFDARVAVVTGNRVLSWNDPTPVVYHIAGVAADPETYRNDANEIGFNIYHSTDDGATFTKLNAAYLPANSTSYTLPGGSSAALYKVEAFNAAGSTFTPVASGITVTVAVTNTPPFNAPAQVNLSASVGPSPAGVTITQVDFYNGTTLIGTDTTSPYTFNWPSVMGGVYSVTAKVTDSRGVVNTSAPITVTVTGALTASFTISPADVSFCSLVTLTSTSSGTPSPSTFGWSTGGTTNVDTIPAGSLLPGTYPVTLTVGNGVETATVTNNLLVVNHPPTAIPGGPYTVLPGGNVTLNGSGNDSLDPCNTAPLSYAWNVDNRGAYDYFTANPTISFNVLNTVLGVGTHTMTLQVTDTNGGVGTATTILKVAGTAALTAPVNGTSLTGSSQTFTWNDSGASLYTLWIGTTVGGQDIGVFPSAAGTTGTSTTVNGLPTNGSTLYVRLLSQVGTTWTFNDYTFTAFSQSATMISPVNLATLAGSNQTFTWSNSGASLYSLWLGTTVGGQDIGVFPSNAGTTGTSTTVNGLPTNGSTIHARLWSLVGATWIYNDYTYTAFSPVAAMITPVNLSTLAGSSQTFTWNNSGASLYSLWIGTTVGGQDIGVFPSAAGTTNTSTIVSGLPVNSSTIHVRLWSLVGATWSYNDYTYTAFSSTPSMITPANLATLAGSSQIFSWNNTGASLYSLWIGTSAGAQNIGVYPSAAGTTGTFTTVNGLPTNGSTIYVRLWALIGTNWIYSDYTYTAFSSTAAMITPVNLATITGGSQTFTWNNSGASLYSLWVGTSAGGQDIGVFPSNAGTTGTSTTVSGLPTNGSTIYVRLWSQIGANWTFNDYTYTANP